MNTFFGFLLLIGPLVVVVLWLPFCWWIARKVSKRFTSSGTRWASGITAFLVVSLLPFVDSIAGRIYLNHLCSTEAGVKIYQTVELPAEYWDGEGKPKFYVNQYDHNKLRYIFPDKRMIDAPQFQYTWVTQPYSEVFHIEKDVLQIADREKAITLGEYFLFRYWGGWLARNFDLVHNSAASCEAKDLDSWPLNIFKPATSTQ